MMASHLTRSIPLLLFLLCLNACGIVTPGTTGSAEFEGSLDTTFITGSGFTGDVDRIYFRPDDNILVTGRMNKYDGSSIPQLARLNSKGGLDTGFNTILNAGPSSSVFTATFDNDGNIFLGGDFSAVGSQPLYRIAKLSSSGALDVAFLSSGTPRGFDDQVNMIVTDSAGRLLVGGEFNSYRGSSVIRLARLDATSGTVDSSFLAQVGNNANTSFNLAINAIVPNSDGTILLGGSFSLFKLANRGRLVLLNGDGTEDTTFASAIGTGFNGDVQVIVEDPSHSAYLIGGNFTKFNGQDVPRIVRMGKTGVLDESFIFAMGEGPSQTVKSIVVDSDGGILVGGDFVTWSNLPAKRIARIDTDGNTDTAFLTKVGEGFNGSVRTLALQSDGKILVGGEFTTYQNSQANKIARLK